jgi:uncharacterized membrane protein YoaK (UPF0700 family)
MTSIRMRPETLLQGLLLAVVGGYLDGFSFVRFGVFANAQTGNIALLGIDAGGGHWTDAALRLAPIVAFVAGIVVVEVLGRPAARRSLHRPLRVVLAVEVAGLALVAALPDSAPELAVTVPVSLVAAIQFSTFRTIVDTPYTSLLASGNLRSMVIAVQRRVVDRDRAAGRQAGRLGAVLLSFVIAAALGGYGGRHIGNAAAAIPIGVLLLVLVLLIAETYRVEHSLSTTAGEARDDQADDDQADDDQADEAPGR